MIIEINNQILNAEVAFSSFQVARIAWNNDEHFSQPSRMVFEGVPKLMFEFNHLKTFFLFIYENVGSSIERCKKYLHLKKI